jgi:hypothetical protein
MASNGKRLLILAPAREDGPALSSYHDTMLRGVVAHAESILGEWENVDVVAVTGDRPLSRIAADQRADHVLLMGSRLSPVIGKLLGTEQTGHALFGLLAHHQGRRWIATPSLAVYGSGPTAHWGQASLLGHLYRHLEMLRIGLPGWDDPSERAYTRVVTDQASWNELRRLLERSRVVAIDSETRDLRRIGNVLLTLQFGADGRTGWVLPVSHPGSPLEPRVLRSAMGWLREYFESGDPVVHVYAGAVFDLHQLIDSLRVRWYNHRIWDVQAAEFNLDENRMLRGYLGAKKGEMWALERLCVEYGMDHYEHAPVGKADRTRLEALPLRDVAPYAALDVVLPIRLMRMQRAIARFRDSRIPGQPYRRFDLSVTDVASSQLQQFAFMERNGLKVDTTYVTKMQGPDSPFLKEIREAEARFLAMPEVQEANQRLLCGRNVRSSVGLFGRPGSGAQAFDPGKPAHQQELFFKVMGLRPLSERADGGGSVNAEFKKRYADNKVVAGFADLEEAKKLNGTFLVGYHKLLRTNPDNRDGRLRTRYGYLNVKTGRSASTDPNLQNVPERKSRAKLVKRQFVSCKGRLYCKSDFSAHEVRMWGAAARDPAVAKTFWNGMRVRLRYEYQVTIPEERRKWWSEQLKAADVHYQNYALLYNVPAVSVTKDQRGSVKSVIFGAIYGKGIPALAKDMKATEAEAREVSRVIFKEKFRKGGDWLDACKKTGAQTMRVVNPLGGVRHLFGYLHPERHVRSAMDRRGPNSAVQGPSSALGYKGGYMMRRLVWEWFESRGVHLDYIQCNAVHDSTETEVGYVNIPLVEYLRHHAYTTLLHRWMRDVVGHELLVGFEMDCKIGATLAEMHDASRWDEQVEAIEKGIRFGNENLGWGEDIPSIMRVVRHNARIIHDIRRGEIRRQLERAEPVNYHMFMTRENCLNLGLRFKAPAPEKKATSGWRRELEDEQ